jgi:SpoVK/Ycf46/Vps4 family AAA+-type ATPase
MLIKRIFYSLLILIIIYIIITIIATVLQQESLQSSIVFHKKYKDKYSLNIYEWLIVNSCVSDLNDDNLNIIGHHDVVNDVETIMNIIYSKMHIKCTLLDPPNGILLYGPPGTGKTMLSKYIAKRLKKKYGHDVTFIKVTNDVIENKWVGEGLKIIKAVFTLADKISPCVIFFDELDGFMSTRSSLDQSHVNTMKTSLLTNMDFIEKNKQVLFIGATNRIDSLDPAILRRLNIQYYMDMPTKEDRIDMFKDLLKNEKLSDSFDFEMLSIASENMSLANINDYCKYCARVKFRNGNISKPWLTSELNLFNEYNELPNCSEYFTEFVNE